MHVDAYCYQKVMMQRGINACQYQSLKIDRHQWVEMPVDIEINK